MQCRLEPKLPNLRHPLRHRHEHKQLHLGAALACHPQARNQLPQQHDQPQLLTSACCLQVTSHLYAYAQIWCHQITLLSPIHLRHRQDRVLPLPRLLQAGQSHQPQNVIYAVVMWTSCRKGAHRSSCYYCIEDKNVGSYGFSLILASSLSCLIRCLYMHL